MNKRVLISLVLLILAFSACIVSYTMIVAEIGKLRGSLYDALFTAENYGVKGGDTDAVYCSWEDAEKKLGLFLDSSDLEAVGERIGSLDDYSREKNSTEYCKTIVECLEKLETLLDECKIKAKEIL